MDWKFDVRREELKCQDGVDTQMHAIRRVDNGNILGVVSKTYGLIEHKDVVENTEKVLDDIGEWKRGTTNLSKEGARLSVNYEFPKMNFNVGKTKLKNGNEVDDIINPRLTLINSYDGSTEFGFILGAMRLVCTNGMRANVSFFKIKRRHTSGIDVQNILERGKFAMQMFTEKTMPRCKELTQEKIPSLGQFFLGLRKDKALPKRLIDTIAKDIAVKAAIDYDEKKVCESLMEYGDTKWNVYNSFTNYLTHTYDRSNERREELSGMVSNVFGL